LFLFGAFYELDSHVKNIAAELIQKINENEVGANEGRLILFQCCGRKFEGKL
jgi:hypothetical protein